MSTRLKEIYKCKVCGNIIEVVRASTGNLVCCGANMEKLAESTEDQGKEKHVPVVEKTENGFRVKVGEVPHPMEEEHHIEWIQLIVDGASYRRFLKPGDEPVAEFCVKGDSAKAREFCNLHGLWASR